MQVPPGFMQDALRKRKALRTPLEYLFLVNGFFWTANAKIFKFSLLGTSPVALSHRFWSEMLGDVLLSPARRWAGAGGSGAAGCSSMVSEGTAASLTWRVRSPSVGR